jgi:hypothetical protein
MRWSQKTGSTKRALLAVEKNKQLKNLFWDVKWQSEQGKKSIIKQKKIKDCFTIQHGKVNKLKKLV